MPFTPSKKRMLRHPQPETGLQKSLLDITGRRSIRAIAADGLSLRLWIGCTDAVVPAFERRKFLSFTAAYLYRKTKGSRHSLTA